MKKVIEMLERHPAVRFGHPAVAIVGCTLLFLFGIFCSWDMGYARER